MVLENQTLKKFGDGVMVVEQDYSALVELVRQLKWAQDYDRQLDEHLVAMAASLIGSKGLLNILPTTH